MIEIDNVTKVFDDIRALNGVSLSIQDNAIYGLVGTNGAGKSTLMRIMSGVLKEDEGSLLIDGENVYNNVKIKENIFFIPDDYYSFPNATPKDMCRFYKKYYRNFDEELFYHLLDNFRLPPDRKLNSFSKGMQKQVNIVLALAAKTKYIFCDETFDGLDPVMRQGVKSLLAANLSERECTVVIASHNLRELEYISDHIGLLHRGGVLLSKDLDDMKLSIHKIQAIFNEKKEKEHFLDVDILQLTQRGSLYTLVVRGEEEAILKKLAKHNPLFIEALPLSLEEIFISETEVKGYDVKKLIF
ncbi:MAG: ABC transporter ATP-binding protein [Bacillota bacterium]|nr:ABC transporter ATP-binding protein [Bacillota bacterium]